jgi:hypothetical protein
MRIWRGRDRWGEKVKEEIQSRKVIWPTVIVSLFYHFN